MSQKLAERAAKLLGRRGPTRRSFLQKTALVEHRARGRAEGLHPPARLRVRGAVRVRRPELRVRLAVLRRLHRVLLHDDRRQRLPAGHDRRRAGGRPTARATATAPATTSTATRPAAAAAAASAPDNCSNAPWGCSCGKGDCNNRKAGCTAFRYGQCNQQVGDASGASRAGSSRASPRCSSSGNCSPTLAVDNSTANHNKPCLQDIPPREEGGR